VYKRFEKYFNYNKIEVTTESRTTRSSLGKFYKIADISILAILKILLEIGKST
jgi:hypothetical protein